MCPFSASRQDTVDMDLTDLPISVFTGLKDLANGAAVQLKGQSIFQKDLRQMSSRVQVSTYHTILLFRART